MLDPDPQHWNLLKVKQDKYNLTFYGTSFLSRADLIIKTAINVSSNCAGFERGRILTK